MPVTREKKSVVLQDLIDKFARSKTVIFAGYRGLAVKGMSALRGQLRKGGSEMKIAKKTLMQIAAKENGIDAIPADAMEGPVAATFSYEDELAGLQALYKFSKENETLVLLGGIIDGKVVGPAEVKKYATLPSREQLLAKFMGSMNAPVTGWVSGLGNVIGGFVRALNAYKNSRSS